MKQIIISSEGQLKPLRNNKIVDTELGDSGVSMNVKNLPVRVSYSKKEIIS